MQFLTIFLLDAILASWDFVILIFTPNNMRQAWKRKMKIIKEEKARRRKEQEEMQEFRNSGEVGRATYSSLEKRVREKLIEVRDVDTSLATSIGTSSSLL